MSYAYAVLELSTPAYEEIRRKLVEAGYSHAINSDGVIDMHGLAVMSKGGAKTAPPFAPPSGTTHTIPNQHTRNAR